MKQIPSQFWLKHDRPTAQSLLLACAMMRSPRSGTDKFSVTDMVEALTPLANMKKCPIDWELGRYTKTKRSQGPDRDGLCFYSPLLSQILRFAPGCYPSVVLLREVFLILDNDMGIMSAELRAANKNRNDWAAESADAVRRALKHLLEIKRSQTPFLVPMLKALVDRVHAFPILGGAEAVLVDSEKDVAPVPQAPQLVPDLPPPVVPPPAPRVLQSSVSDVSSGSVEICAAICGCATCKASRDEVVDLQSPSPASPAVGSPRSETSLAAEENQESTDPSRGGAEAAGRNQPPTVEGRGGGGGGTLQEEEACGRFEEEACGQEAGGGRFRRGDEVPSGLSQMPSRSHGGIHHGGPQAGEVCVWFAQGQL